MLESNSKLIVYVSQSSVKPDIKFILRNREKKSNLTNANNILW